MPHGKQTRSLVVLALIAILLGLSALACTDPLPANGRASSEQAFASEQTVAAPRPDFRWGIYHWRHPRSNETDPWASEFASRPHFITFYHDLGRGFPRRGCDRARALGATPVISLELWYWGPSPRNVLPEIAAGQFDDHFRLWADEARDYGFPVYLRFGFEMNGDWFTWGNQSPTFVASWRRIHDIFREQGANNVVWVWCPNNVSIPREPANTFASYYPGDSYVDWFGVDGYNFGDNHDVWHHWETFDEVFDPALAELAAISLEKPLMIAEFGCADGPRKAAWILDAYRKIQENPRIRIAIWFNLDKRREGEPNWSVNSDPNALAAFNRTFANPSWTTANATNPPAQKL